VTLRWESPPERVEFFPAPEDALKISDVKVTTSAPRGQAALGASAAAGAGAETQVRFHVELLKGQKLVGRNLTTVVAGRDARGERRGVRMDFPLDRLANPGDK
jgi:hypothetical protein